MYKIPMTYHLRKMSKADTLEGMLKEWQYFNDQMFRQTMHFNQLLLDQLIKYFKAFKPVS